MVQGTHLLLATGRTPNVSGLNLEAAAIKYDKRGIQVSKGLVTSNSKAFAIGDVLYALHEFTQPTGERFDEHKTGLDHISFGCADRAGLEEWQARLEDLGIPHGGIMEAHYGTALAFRDPDNIALEFFAPPG